MQPGKKPVLSESFRYDGMVRSGIGYRLASWLGDDRCKASHGIGVGGWRGL